MPNMSLTKEKMPEQKPDVRNKNFCEVALGYTSEMAINEAQRCLNCKNKPCMDGCPVGVKIPEFIEFIKNGDIRSAYLKITETNALPAVCGRVCPQESQCEAKCVRAVKGESVAIGRLERYVADYVMNSEININNNEEIITNNHKVAIVGSGPAGLTCASELNKMGYDVTIFEAFHLLGGVLSYGIPEFRLPKKIVNDEIKNLEKSGIKIIKNVVIGRSITIDELFEDGYKAVFIGSGAGLPSFMNIEGENLNGVFSANEFLTRINLMKAYEQNAHTPVIKSKNVAVIGGGNVAMDAARCAKRIGAENVYIIYRRSLNEMPARLEEIHHAQEEGIIFKFLTNPVKIHPNADGWVEKIECVEMKLSEPDVSGRQSPVEIPDSNMDIEVQTVIMAVGTSPNPLIRSTTEGLQANKRGCIITNDSGATSKKGVFAGGDAVTGAATVILAMGAGKTSAKAIDEYIKETY